jgi:acetyl esterase/lipase
MPVKNICAVLVIAASLTAAAAVGADSTREPAKMPAPVVEPSGVVPLWPGVAPGSEKARQVEKSSQLPGSQQTVVRNVVQPTLTVYLPEAAQATGTGVIIAPGGGFRFLSMDSEGHDVARWLVARGIAAFVLKYRVVETPAEDMLAWTAVMASLAAAKVSIATLDDDGQMGIADGLQATKVVRENAKKWRIEPDRIGFLGFSAGAMIASHTMLRAAPADRPRFVAPVYGAPFGQMPDIPAQLPPVFLAYASDDPLVGARVDDFYAALRRAGHSPELHVYSKGGHGFGMKKQGTSSDYWIEDFHHWLVSLGLTSK